MFESPVFYDTLGLDQTVGTLDDTLSLRPGSPGIDIGDNSSLPPDSLDVDGDGDVREPIPFDIAGNPRVVDGGSGVLKVDVGAYEYTKTSTSVSDAQLEIPRESRVGIEVYPNPARCGAAIVLDAISSERGDLGLYDVQGRLVAQLFSGVLQRGDEVHLFIPCDLPSGFFTLVFTGNKTSSRKAIIRIR